MSYLGAPGFAGAGASAATKRKRAAVETVRAVSRLGKRRILRLLGDAAGAEATAVIARRDAEAAFKGPAEDIAARMQGSKPVIHSIAALA
jgi:hypothetical protein